MNNKKKIVLVLLIIAFVILLVFESKNVFSNNNSYHKETITLTEGNSTIIQHYSARLESSDNEIISIDNDKIIANKEGTAYIKVIKDNKTIAEYEIVVLPLDQEEEKEEEKEEPQIIKISSIEIINKKETLKVGNKVVLNYKITPDDATDKSVMWLSSDESVASVKDGEVTAKSVGSAQISVVTKNGKSSNAYITVVSNEIQITDISLNPNNKTIYVGESFTITPNILPTNATNKKITWTSSDNSIAIVTNGTVKGIKEGNVTITAEISNGKKATSTITVKNKELEVIHPSGVSLNKQSQTVYTNSNINEVNLVATVYPNNAQNKEVIWSSSDNNVASVSNGKVTIKSLGKATITVKTKDGNYTDKYVLTVRKRVIIVIGASQVGRMKNGYGSFKGVKSYHSDSSNFDYLTSNGTLTYVAKGSTKTDYQVNEGFNIAKQDIINNTNNPKNYTDFYIFFPIAGNEASQFTCKSVSPNGEWYISTNNSHILEYALLYNDRISKLKQDGYSVKAFVTSIQPVVVSQATSDKVVTNNNANSCKKEYRSNVKYYTYNNAIGSIINSKYSTNLKYISLFEDIMITNPDGTNYSFKYKDYKTTDGIHWDESTTRYYVKLMFDKTSAL